MKHIIFLLTLGIFLVAQINVHAQRNENNKERWEKYRAEKVAFLTTNLDLTPEEAQKFWPIYNKMDKEKSEAQQKRRELEHKVRDGGESLSDEAIIKLTREFATTMEKEGALHNKYNEEFLKILPPKKVLSLYKAEGDFRIHMIKKYRDQRKNGGKHP